MKLLRRWQARYRLGDEFVVQMIDAIEFLKGEGFRVVRLDHYDNFLDDDPDSATEGQYLDAYVVVEEL